MQRTAHVRHRWNVVGHMIVSLSQAFKVGNTVDVFGGGVSQKAIFILLTLFKMFDWRLYNNEWKIFKNEPTHELWRITGSKWPYYNSKKLAEYFEETIEKKYHLKGNEIVIYIHMDEKYDWKKLLKWKFEVTINWKKWVFKYDFSKYKKDWLIQILWELEQNVDKFVEKNTLSSEIYRTLNTPKNQTLYKQWNQIFFPDGSFIDTSNIKLDDLKKYKNCGFIYGSNIAWILGWWQAQYWSESNALGIPTRPDLSWYFNDKDFFKNKQKIDEAFTKIFKFIDEWKPIIIPANWVWTWFAQLQNKAPYTLKYINSKLDEVKAKNNKMWLIQTKQSRMVA